MEADYLLGRMKQLQMSFPGFVSDVRRGELVLDIEFYLEDIAIDASHALLDDGITAVHRMDRPRVISLQLPSLIEQGQEALVVDVLHCFLRYKIGGAGGVHL